MSHNTKRVKNVHNAIYYFCFFRMMLEDHLYWCMIMERWIYRECRDIIKIFAPSMFDGPSWMPKFMIRPMFAFYGKQVWLKQAIGAGIGRLPQDLVHEAGRCASDMTLFSRQDIFFEREVTDVITVEDGYHHLGY